ncbi:MAG: hypothetical protein AAF599_20040, partial [Bacteroidota bacterium]
NVTLTSDQVCISGVNFTDGEYFSLALPQAPTGPGGVASQVWLKADNGLSVDGSNNATTWKDNSGNSRDADVVTSDPQKLDNFINFNPAIDFDGNDQFQFSSSPFVSSYTAAEAVVVTKDDAWTSCQCGPPYNFGGSAESLYSWNNSNIYDNNFTNDRLGFNPLIGSIIDGKSGLAITGDPVDVRDWNIYGTYSATNEWGLQFNGEFKAMTTTNTTSFALTAANEQIGVGRNRGFNGDIAEVILFDKVLTTTERNQVNSYLGIKYGMTLKHDYVSSAGTTIKTLGSGYDNDITGIGQDDDSGLFQTQSKSINENSVVTISNPSALSDGDFVIFGDDGASTINRSMNVPAAYEERIERVWQADVLGTPGTVELCFERNALPGLNPDPSKIAVLTSTSTDFSAASDFSSVTITDDQVCVSGVMLNDNDYFTLALPLKPNPAGCSSEAAVVWYKTDAGLSE